jgi:hypothetical protein
MMNLRNVVLQVATFGVVLLGANAANAQSFAWANKMGGAGYDGATDVAVDAAGNIYVLGFYEFTADFDPGPGVYDLTAIGERDVFVLKLSPDGAFVWAVSFGTAISDRGHDLALDNLGNVYVTGGQTTAGVDGSWIAKLNNAGSIVWERRLGGVAGYYGVAVGPDGNIIAVGSFQGTVDFDPGPNTHHVTASGSYNAFILKLNEAGEFLWVKLFRSTIEVGARGVALDESRNIHVTGATYGSTDFDPGPASNRLPSASTWNGYAAKLTSDGGFLWVRRLKDVFNIWDYGRKIQVDSHGNVYTAGITDNDSSFGVLCKFNSSGQLIWSRMIDGPAQYDEILGLALDAQDNVYLSGNLGNIGFVMKRNPQGRLLWRRQVGSVDRLDRWAQETDVAIGQGGDVVISGMFTKRQDFDPGVKSFFMTASSVAASVFKLTQP